MGLGPARAGGTKDHGGSEALIDRRREIRVFLASSYALAEERKQFPAELAAIGARPGIARSFRLRAVRWEKDAYGSAHPCIDDTIQESVDFEASYVVVVLVRDWIGEGTRRECEDALALGRVHETPKLLAYFRTPTSEASPENLRAVDEFKDELIAAGVVTSTYDDPAELFRLLGDHLPAQLPQPDSESAPPAALRRGFLRAATVNVALAVAVITLCRVMRFPDDGVNWWTVVAVLAAPFFLLITGYVTSASYERLLSSFAHVWRSDQWTEQAIYEVLRGVVPRAALPKRPAGHFPRSSAMIVLLVALGLFAGVIAQYNCIFEEILLWQYAVGWDVVPGEEGRAEAAYVDRRKEGRWPFGLQDPAVRGACEAERVRENLWHCVIYVHAHGKFEAPDGQKFRANLGPEVWLPVHAWVYVVVMGLTVALALRPFVRLLRFRSELVGERRAGT